MFVIAFCVILGPEYVYLDTEIFYLNPLETDILKHVDVGYTLAVMLEIFTAMMVKY